MKLLRLVLRAFPHRLVTVILFSLLSGVGNAVLVAWISRNFAQAILLSTHRILLLLAFACVVLAFDTCAKQLITRLAGSTSYALRSSLSRQILAMPLEALERIGSPRLMAMLTEDILNLSITFHSLPNICVSLANLSFCTLYLLWFSPRMAVLLGLVAILPFFIHSILQKRARAAMKAMLLGRNEIFSLYRVLVEGIQELKLHAARRNAFLHDLLEPTAKRVQKLGIENRIWHQATQIWAQAVSIGMILVVFLWCTWQKSSTTEIATYAFVILLLKSVIGSLLSMLPLWADARVIVEQIEAVGFAFRVEPPPLPSVVYSKPESVHLKVERLVYRYSHTADEVGFQLGPITLDFHSGEIVFLAGGNGSGKTTLIKLLSGLYTQEEGSVFLNGEAIDAENREAYRQNFAAIWVDFFLFDRLLGISPQELDSHAEHYLKLLQLEDKVVVKDGILSTIAISHGQRKRLALLTAYLEDRPIYLFDEWASGQDPEFREVFYRQLLPDLKQKGKLVIVISHDEQYFNMADRRIYLDFGHVVSES